MSRQTVFHLLTAFALVVVASAGCASPDSVHTSSGGQCAGGGGPSAFQSAAHVVFVGLMLRGPTVHTPKGDILVSPASMRVIRYMKGNGPKTVTVQTAISRVGDTTTMNAEGIQARIGQRWRIYATSSAIPYRTSICAGSKPIARD